MKKVDVSFIVPVYNVKKYIKECVETIKKVNLSKEIILIDDGSNDGSELICEELANNDSEIVTFHKKNGGLSSARNYGIKKSVGSYIVFVDSDDFLNSEETNNIFKDLEKNYSEPELIMGFYDDCFDNGIAEHNKTNDLYNMKGEIDIRDFLSNIKSNGKECILTAWRFIIKTSFLKENDLFFMDGIVHEDEEWLSRVLTTATSIYIARHYFYKYRRNRDSSITNKINIKNVYDRFIIMKSMINTRKKCDATQYEYINKRISLLFLCNLFDYKVVEKKDENTYLCEMNKYKGIYLSTKHNDKKMTILKFPLFFIGVGKTAKIIQRIRGQ